jgi:hypothetical protein
MHVIIGTYNGQAKLLLKTKYEPYVYVNADECEGGK